MTSAATTTVDRLHEAHDRKRFARLQALGALAGYAVDAIDADGGGIEYCITRWAMTKRCGTLEGLAAQLARMGVAE